MTHFIKYSLTAILSYGFLYGSMFVSVSILHINPAVAYAVIVSLIYIALFISYRSFVFKQTPNKGQARRFLIALAVTWVLNQLFFNLLQALFHLPHYWIITINAGVFGLFRFFVQKNYVFAEPQTRDRVVLSFDLELWHESDWIKKELGTTTPHDMLEESMRPLVDLLDKHQAQATFFVTSAILQKYPHIITDLIQRGHEIGSHSAFHTRLTKLTPQQFTAEMQEHLALFKTVTGTMPRGFRAPHFSLVPTTTWLIDCLSQFGFTYDSSLFPVKTPEYGLTLPSSQPYRISKQNLITEDSTGTLWEIPVAQAKILGISLPVAGGVYFRLLPLWVFRLLLQFSHQPALLYFHPHELCAQTPQVASGPRWKRTLKYWGTKHSLQKLDNLLKHYSVEPLHSLITKTK